MACIFISDGGPEAEDYENNYFHFNESDKRTTSLIESFLSHKDITDPEVRAQLHRICQASLSQ